MHDARALSLVCVCVCDVQTEDRRKELVKVARGLGEDGKVAIRNVRRDAVDGVKKLGKKKDEGVSEDMCMDAQDSIQKITDKYIKLIDDTVAKKEKDITTV